MPVSLQNTHIGLYSEDIPFWQELARQSTGPILELGCGSWTGITAYGSKRETGLWN